MRYLFCHVIWMKFYEGTQKTDTLDRALLDSLNSDDKQVLCNFRSHKKMHYGYVTSNNKTININRLGAHDDQKSIEDITVIWTAKSPEHGKPTVVVGWYRDAKVYRHEQLLKKPSKRHQKNDVSRYLIQADAKDCVLLPAGERVLQIPRGGKGMMTGHLWYADGPENAAVVAQTLMFIENYQPAIAIKGKKATVEKVAQKKAKKDSAKADKKNKK